MEHWETQANANGGQAGQAGQAVVPCHAALQADRARHGLGSSCDGSYFNETVATFTLPSRSCVRSGALPNVLRGKASKWNMVVFEHWALTVPFVPAGRAFAILALYLAPWVPT
jgi:hypothetical protein